MKKYMPLEGLRWSRDSGSTLCDTPQNGRSRTGWGGANSTPLKLGLFNCSQSPKYSKVFLERNQFFTTSLGSTGFFCLAISVMQM